MACVPKNVIDCDKIRKITINQINIDKTVTKTVLYFNIDTSEQISEKDAQQCPNIKALEFTCATVCN